MLRIRLFGACLLTLLIAVVLSAGRPSPPQAANKQDMDRARQMLRDAYDNVKKHYYDPTYHGLAWDARYHQYDEEMRKATSLNQGFGIVAEFLEGLHDSHTFFVPPARPFKIEYGYRMALYGDNAFVTRTRPGTDADSKLHPGDQVVALNGSRINRESFHTIQYFFDALAPQTVERLNIITPDGKTESISINSKMQQLKKVMDLTGSDGGTDIYQLIREDENSDHVVRPRYVEMGDVMVLKLPEFELESSQVDHLYDIARKHKTLILDLRDNPGGDVDTLERMIGNVFDHDVKIGDRIGIKEHKPFIAKPRASNVFTGKIIVLVDSSSASAAELYAQIMQLENRGTVLGDRSSGKVMEARGYSCSPGADTRIFYLFSITDADLTMKDGKSLEHLGVTPDEIVLPTAQDIAAGRDPVLVRALEISGITIDPVKAGKMFPFEWLPF